LRQELFVKEQIAPGADALLATATATNLSPAQSEKLLAELGFNWNTTRDYLVVSKDSLKRVSLSAMKDMRLTDVACKVLAITPEERSTIEATTQQLAADGADLIDIGGESTRPGSNRVELAEQIRRVVPVLKAAAPHLPVVWSIDTRSSQVAAAAIDAGATIVNDISAARDDPQMLPLLAKSGLPLILMHMQGTPATMQVNPRYENVIEEVKTFFAEQMKAAVSAGIPSHRILLDPGIGFGKTVEHNLTLLREMKRLTELGRPLVIGTSRKGFIGAIARWLPAPANRPRRTAAAKLPRYGRTCETSPKTAGAVGSPCAVPVGVF